jgi:mannose/fructose/N-acetylgalactosamine-specific phosphotransferase system component IIC
MSYLIPSMIIGILALDTTVAFQVLLSQPIFACPIIGWVLGNPQAGFEVGLIMQLLWLNVLPVGSVIFPEGNVASMVICAITVLFDDLPYPNIVFTFAVLIGIAISYVGSWLTVLDRKINGVFFNAATKSARQINMRRMNFIEILSIFIYFVIMTLLAYFFLIISGMVLHLIKDTFSLVLEEKLVMVRPVLFGIGLMLTFHLIIDRVKKKLSN